jgi:hypothetical protein
MFTLPLRCGSSNISSILECKRSARSVFRRIISKRTAIVLKKHLVAPCNASKRSTSNYVMFVFLSRYLPFLLNWSLVDVWVRNGYKPYITPTTSSRKKEPTKNDPLLPNWVFIQIKFPTFFLFSCTNTFGKQKQTTLEFINEFQIACIPPMCILVPQGQTQTKSLIWWSPALETQDDFAAHNLLARFHTPTDCTTICIRRQNIWRIMSSSSPGPWMKTTHFIGRRK